MNEVLKTIRDRYSCRSYTGAPIPPADLQAIAQAAMQAPSGMNRRPWHVIFVTNTALLAEMDAEGVGEMSKMKDKTVYDRIQSRGGKLFYNAPCMALVLTQGAAPIDCGILAQNIVLAAASLGINSVHCGLASFAFAGEKGAQFKERLGFPAGYELGIGVLLGYETAPGTPRVPDMGKVSMID